MQYVDSKKKVVVYTTKKKGDVQLEKRYNLYVWPYFTP